MLAANFKNSRGVTKYTLPLRSAGCESSTRRLTLPRLDRKILSLVKKQRRRFVRVLEGRTSSLFQFRRRARRWCGSHLSMNKIIIQFIVDLCLDGLVTSNSVIRLVDQKAYNNRRYPVVKLQELVILGLKFQVALWTDFDMAAFIS